MIPAYILDGARTPRASVRKGTSAYIHIHPQELFAQTLRSLAAGNNFRPEDVEHLYVGCVSQIKEQGGNLARNAALSAGWPAAMSAVTLNMYCGSALQAVNMASMAVMSGSCDLVAAGGVESMSRVPMFADGGGLDGLNAKLRERIEQVPQGISADLIATLEGFSRHDLDQFSYESHMKAALAISGGYPKHSLAMIKDDNGTTVLENDNHVRPDTTVERLSELKPAFETLGQELDHVALRSFSKVNAIKHLHTAGSSSGIADGASAVIIGSKDYALKSGARARAVIRSISAIGTDPILMLTGPSICSQKALAKADLRASDIDLWEINEAFAAVPLQTMRALKISPDRVNVNGGAIALGHPLGATGAILLLTLLDELERRDLTLGVVTLCIAGGQGIATIVERV